MTRLILTIAIIYCTILTLKAQESDRITLVKTDFKQNGVNIRHSEILKTLKSNPSAYTEMKSAIDSKGASMLISIVGGFMIGWPLGTGLGGGDANWTIFAVGTGLVFISIPIANGFKKKASSALDKYYSSNPTSYNSSHNPQLSFATSRNGIGLILKY